jgi:flagellar motor component MotA
MSILGFVIMLAILAYGAIGTGTPLGAYLDPPSCIIVVLGSGGGVLMAYGAQFGAAFKAAFGGSADGSALAAGAAVFRTWKTYSLAWGFVGMGIGWIAMLAGVGGSESPVATAALLGGIGVSLISPFYGLFFAYGVAHPLASRCSRRLDASSDG